MGRGIQGLISSAAHIITGNSGSFHLSALLFPVIRLCSQAAPLLGDWCSSFRRNIQTAHPWQRRSKSPARGTPGLPETSLNIPATLSSWPEAAPRKLGSDAQNLQPCSVPSAPCSSRSERTFSWHPQAFALFKNKCCRWRPLCVTYVACSCPSRQDLDHWFKNKPIRTTPQTQQLPTSLESFGYCGKDKKLGKKKNPGPVRKKEVEMNIR